MCNKPAKGTATELISWCIDSFQRIPNTCARTVAFIRGKSWSIIRQPCLILLSWCLVNFLCKSRRCAKTFFQMLLLFIRILFNDPYSEFLELHGDYETHIILWFTWWIVFLNYEASCRASWLWWIAQGRCKWKPSLRSSNSLELEQRFLLSLCHCSPSSSMLGNDASKYHGPRARPVIVSGLVRIELMTGAVTCIIFATTGTCVGFFSLSVSCTLGSAGAWVLWKPHQITTNMMAIMANQ